MNASMVASREPDIQVWPSYADVSMNIILLLLLALFTQIILSSQTSALMLEIRRKQTELRNAVERSIPESMRQDVIIKEDGNLQRFSFADRVLFDSAQANLKETGKDILENVGRVFKLKVGSFSKIQIEGHTDNQPIRGAFPSNWELSSARSTSVVRFLQDSAGLDPALLSATGYSEYHPVIAENTDAARARNRRIELVVVYSVNQSKDQGDSDRRNN